MGQSVDFSDFLDDSTDSSDKLARLSQLAKQSRQLEAEIVAAESTLKTKQAALRTVLEKDIPELMAELSLKRLDLDDGGTITVADEVFANISEARADAAFSWLDENGHGGIVKRNILIAFGRDEEKAGAFLAELEARAEDKRVEHKMERKVESATLKKFARERLAEHDEAVAEGEAPPDFPRELFGVFTKRVAKIKSK